MSLTRSLSLESLSPRKPLNETESPGDVGCAPDTRCTEILPRVSATFTGLCLLLHVALVIVAGSGMLSMSLPMLGLAALCGGCAFGAWQRRCSDRALGLTALVAGAMVSFHMVLMSGHASQAICSSMADSPAMVPPVTELLMSAGVVCAGIVGLVATGVLAQRRLATGSGIEW